MFFGRSQAGGGGMSIFEKFQGVPNFLVLLHFYVTSPKIFPISVGMYGPYPSLILPVLLKEYLMLHANEGHDVAVVVVAVVAKVSLVEVQLKVHVDLEVVIVSLGILGGEVLLEEPKMSNIKVRK